VNFHSFSVSHFFDAATFAIYSVACLHVPLIALVASPATNVMMVLMAENMREGRQARNLLLWHDTTRKLASFFFPLVALLLVVAPVLVVYLFGDQYEASVPIFQLWTLTILNAAFQTGGVLRVFAQTRFLLFINVVQLLIIGGLTAWFIRRFGLYGGALVTILSLVVARILTLSRLRSCMDVDIVRLLPWRSLASIGSVSLGAALAPLAIYRAFPMHPLAFLTIATVAYGSTYVLLLLRFGLLTIGEKAALRRWIQQMTRPALRIAETKE
jgi:O-antigen/teichoic acid export membrane protein